MYSPTFIPAAARSVRTSRKHGAAAKKIGFQVKPSSSFPFGTSPVASPVAISPPPGDHQLYPPSAGSYQNLYPSVLPPASIIIPHSAAPSATPSGSSSSSNNNNPHINPSVVVIVVILSVVFILSGFLHLLARCLGRRLPASPPRHSPLVSALHGQLQHLFHLHDAGVEQAFIDTLPVFSYGSIRGLKDSADCAVCLTEFAEDDRLRLLPKCKHAFHLECIDTWLLSNSTCPLCRRSLLPDPTGAGAGQSSSQNELDASESMHSNRFIGLTLEEQMMRDSRRNISLHGSIHGSYQNSFRICEVEEVDDDESEDEIQVEVETPSPLVPTIRVVDANGSQRILKVELGKVSGKVKADSRKLTGARRGGRSYSMGSYEYVVDPSNLELMIAPTPFPGRPQDWAPSKPTHRSALSDSIPELASAGGTPANDDLFWASRGLYTPQTLSRVRELLTPSPGSNAFFSPAFPDYQYFADRGDRWIDVNIERDSEMVDDEDDLQDDEDEDEDGDEDDEDIEQQPNLDHSENLERLRLNINNIAASTLQDSVLDKENDFKQRSSSLSRLPEGVKVSVSYRRSLSETAGMEQAAAATCKDAAHHGGNYNSSDLTNSVKQAGSSFSRRFSFNWLMGRDKRMVFSAASPSNSSDAATATAETSTHQMDVADMRAIPV